MNSPIIYDRSVVVAMACQQGERRRQKPVVLRVPILRKPLELSPLTWYFLLSAGVSAWISMLSASPSMYPFKGSPRARERSLPLDRLQQKVRARVRHRRVHQVGAVGQCLKTGCPQVADAKSKCGGRTERDAMSLF